MKKLTILALVLSVNYGIVVEENRPDAGPCQRSMNITKEEFLSIMNSPKNKDYPKWAAEQLAQLKEGVSLGEWKSNHPDEKVVMVSPAKIDSQSELWGAWCARAEERLSLPSGKGAIRYAFFYSPCPPSSFVLPESQERESLLDRCILGLIWVTGPAGVSNGNLLAKDAGRAISVPFGESEKNPKISFFGSAHWREISCWRTGQATLISAYVGDECVPLAFGVLPNSGVTLSGSSDYFIWEKDRHTKAISRIKDAMIAAGIVGPARKAMEELLQLNEAWQKGLRPDNGKMLPERVVQTLGHWLPKTTPLPHMQKAAALLAADQVLVEVQHSFKVSQLLAGAAAREALSKLGAEFNDHESLGGGVLYTQSWLSVAQRMDADGPIGDLAFRMLMEEGFDTSGECRGGSAQYEKVIEKGEEYLKNPHESVSKQAVELMVAEAYRDIVGLAEGLGSEYADPQDYKDASPEARRKAIDHFRAALLQGFDTLENRAAWSDAWRLIAGLPPSQLRYFCVYD